MFSPVKRAKTPQKGRQDHEISNQLSPSPCRRGTGGEVVREIEQRATDAYRARFGESPEVVASAPGRVNLLGEHTDYNGGFVLPCAIAAPRRGCPGPW